MSLVNKIFGRRQANTAGNGKTSETDRLAADRARQIAIPQAQSLTDQAAVRARMEEELAQARARREAPQPAPGD
jgi:hypothetical protein